jgi:hypothetical protein
VDLFHSSLTSCDLEKPHYHFSATKIDYYPKERIVFHKAWYWEHGIRLFYLPYFVISLKEKDNNFEYDLGWSETAGWFLYLGYNYFLNDHSFGKIKTHLTEKSGNDLGVEHTIKTAPNVKWIQEYMIWDNSKLGYPVMDYSYRYGYENSSNEKLKTTISLQDWHRFNYYGLPYLEKEYTFNLNSVSPYPGLTVEYTEKGEAVQKTFNIGGRWTFQPDSSLNIDLDGRYYIYTPYLQNQQESFNYDVRASKDWGWSRLSLNLRETRVYNGSITANNVKPDLLFTIPNWQLPLIGALAINARYTRKENVVNNITEETGERYALDIEKIPVNLWQHENLKLEYRSLFQYRDAYTYQYGRSEKEVYGFTNSLGLVDQMTQNLSTEFRLGYTYKWGMEEPFFEESILAGGFVDNIWRWQSEKWQTSLSLGYNLTTNEARPVDFSTSWNPGERQHFELRTTYDWKEGLGQTDLGIDYRPKDNWNLRLGLGYNPRYTVPWTNQQFEAQISDRISEKLRFELAARYDFFRKDFSTAKVRLVYDWHCREVMFYYDWVEREYQLQVLIKAFPQAVLSLQPNAVGFLE